MCFKKMGYLSKIAIFVTPFLFVSACKLTALGEEHTHSSKHSGGEKKINFVTCGGLGNLSPHRNMQQQTKPHEAEQGAGELSDIINGMVLIPAGTYSLSDEVAHKTLSSLAQRGFNRPPVYEYTTEAFWIDAHEITNAEFKAFVDSTGYITTAERPWTFQV